MNFVLLETINNKISIFSELCRPGTYSPDKFETCSTCRHGFFQDEYGQTTCKQCPDGTTTVSTNSSSKSDCKSNFTFIIKIVIRLSPFPVLVFIQCLQ